VNPQARCLRYRGSAGFQPAGSGGILPPVPYFRQSLRGPPMGRASPFRRNQIAGKKQRAGNACGIYQVCILHPTHMSARSNLRPSAGRARGNFKYFPPEKCRRRLIFPRRKILFPHASLRISLREVRRRQRSSGALVGLERCQVSPLRVGQAGQKVFHLRGGRRRQPGCRRLRHAAPARRVLRRPLPRALSCSPPLHVGASSFSFGSCLFLAGLVCVSSR
jgi:hypothetical protein